MGNILILGGNSGSGKSTISNELVQSGAYRQLVTVTTRLPRVGEIDGKDYHFINEQTYDELAKGGRYGELPEQTCYANVKYGIFRKTLDDVLFSDKTTVAVMDAHGVEWMKEWFSYKHLLELVKLSDSKPFVEAVRDFIVKNHSVKSVFVGVGIEEMERRLLERGSNPEEIKRRITQAQEKELSMAYRNTFDLQLWNERGSISSAVNFVNHVFQTDVRIQQHRKDTTLSR